MSAYDVRLVMKVFRGSEAEAVRVTQAAWDWCAARGLYSQDFEWLLRHFEHSGHGHAYANFDTETACNWGLYDSCLSLAAGRAEQPAEQAQQLALLGQHGPDSSQRGLQQGPPGGTLPASFAAMLARSAASRDNVEWERVVDMLVVPHDELTALLVGLSQRLSPAAAGSFVASVPSAHRLDFSSPSSVLEGLAWLLETLPVQGMDGGALAAFLSQAQRLRRLSAATLKRRLSTLQEELGITAEQAGALALVRPGLLLQPDAAVQGAAQRLHRLLPPEQLSRVLQTQPGLLAASWSQLDALARTLHLWAGVVGLPLEACLAQYDKCRSGAAGLRRLSESTLRLRLATLQQALQKAGLGSAVQQEAGALVLQYPELLQRPHTEVGEAAERLHQMLPPQQLSGLLTREPTLLAATREQLDLLEAALHLWTEVVGVPLEACLAQCWHSMQGAAALLRYREPTLRRRLAALRQAAGVGAEQAAALALAHPGLLRRQPAVVREAGAWLREKLPPGVVQKDPELLGAPRWHLRETAAKLYLWTELMGVPPEACMEHYSAAVGGVHLPDVAAACILAQVSNRSRTHRSRRLNGADLSGVELSGVE